MRWADMGPAARAGRVAAIGCFTLPALFAFLALANAIAGAPPEHAITTAGATPIDYQVGYGAGFANGRVVAGLAASSTSLDDFRCAAWRASGREQSCPTATELAKTLWPGVRQTPGTIYVGIYSSSCYPSAGHLNVEYYAGRLVLHCHVAAPWVKFERHLGGGPPPSIELVMIPTAGIPHGTLTVVLDDRVERWLNDQVTTSLLGTVAI